MRSVIFSTLAGLQNAREDNGVYNTPPLVSVIFPCGVSSAYMEVVMSYGVVFHFHSVSVHDDTCTVTCSCDKVRNRMDFLDC